VLLWILVGTVLLAAFWKILAGRLGQAASGAEAGWKLGRWPVNPAAVTTREEMVRAFEYLTLRCLGPAARCWNHLEIAAQLGGDRNVARQQAATHLAGLYEQARYAPPEERLPGTELEAARRHLCFLAGASAA
jgi:hypothetical protein